MIYMFLSNNPSSGDINLSNLPCLAYVLGAQKTVSLRRFFRVPTTYVLVEK